METTQAIQARHTIRDFSNQPVDPAIVEKIIKSGFAAPTNNHMREWHFVLLNDRDKRQALIDPVIHKLDHKGSLAVINRWGLTDTDQREMYLEAIPRQYSMLLNASVLILPIYAQPCPILKPKSLSDLNPFASIWCCIENMLVAAADEGIFGVTRIPSKEESSFIKETLHIPAHFEFPCWLALGYPAENAIRTSQVSIDLSTRIHIDSWTVN
jgi:nitroreductase